MYHYVCLSIYINNFYVHFKPIVKQCSVSLTQNTIYIYISRRIKRNLIVAIKARMKCFTIFPYSFAGANVALHSDNNNKNKK